jgi:DNA-binding NtrC family response regulator
MPEPGHTPPRILIVEDDFLIAAMMAEMVESLGYVVAGQVRKLSDTRDALGRREFDLVLLDLDLYGKPAFEIPDLLTERGTPFAFVTGYSSVAEPRHAAVPLLQKPFTEDQLERLLRQLIGPPPASDQTRVSA